VCSQRARPHPNVTSVHGRPACGKSGNISERQALYAALEDVWERKRQLRAELKAAHGEDRKIKRAVCSLKKCGEKSRGSHVPLGEGTPGRINERQQPPVLPTGGAVSITSLTLGRNPVVALEQNRRSRKPVKFLSHGKATGTSHSLPSLRKGRIQHQSGKCTMRSHVRRKAMPWDKSERDW